MVTKHVQSFSVNINQNQDRLSWSHPKYTTVEVLFCFKLVRFDSICQLICGIHNQSGECFEQRCCTDKIVNDSDHPITGDKFVIPLPLKILTQLNETSSHPVSNLSDRHQYPRILTQCVSCVFCFCSYALLFLFSLADIVENFYKLCLNQCPEYISMCVTFLFTSSGLLYFR